MSAPPRPAAVVDSRPGGQVMVETLGWIAECTMHHWLRFFGDNKAAAEKAWREHVKEKPRAAGALRAGGDAPAASARRRRADLPYRGRECGRIGCRGDRQHELPAERLRAHRPRTARRCSPSSGAAPNPSEKSAGAGFGRQSPGSSRDTVEGCRYRSWPSRTGFGWTAASSSCAPLSAKSGLGETASPPPQSTAG